MKRPIASALRPPKPRLLPRDHRQCQLIQISNQLKQPAVSIPFRTANHLLVILDLAHQAIFATVRQVRHPICLVATLMPIHGCVSQCILTKMRFNTPFIVTLVVAAERVTPQDNPTTTNTANDAIPTLPSIPACILTCTSLVASRDGCDDAYVRFLVPRDPEPPSLITLARYCPILSHRASVGCLCTGEDYESSVEGCITTNCTEEEQAAAGDFLAERCFNGIRTTRHT